MCATSILPSEPLHQLRLTKNNFLLNGQPPAVPNSKLPPRNTFIHSNTRHVQHVAATVRTADEHRSLLLKEMRSNQLEHDSAFSMDSFCLRLTIQAIQFWLKFSRPSLQAWLNVFLAELLFLLLSRTDLVQSLLGNNRIDSDSSAVGFSLWLGRGNTLGSDSSNTRSPRTGLGNPKGGKACNQSCARG